MTREEEHPEETSPREFFGRAWRGLFRGTQESTGAEVSLMGDSPEPARGLPSERAIVEGAGPMGDVRRIPHHPSPRYSEDEIRQQERVRDARESLGTIVGSMDDFLTTDEQRLGRFKRGESYLREHILEHGFFHPAGEEIDEDTARQLDEAYNEELGDGFYSFPQMIMDAKLGPSDSLLMDLLAHLTPDEADRVLLNLGKKLGFEEGESI